MKITGIDIGEYRQFKNIKFDFTYPADYHDPEKVGHPLEKICFIGQSGTGKTTLLNVIWELAKTIDQIIRLRSDAFLDERLRLPESFENIKYSIAVNQENIVFDRNDQSTIPDGNFVDSWLKNNLTKTELYNLIDTNKLCLFIKESISREADAFLFDQKDYPQTFSDFVKTDTQVEKEKINRDERIKNASSKKVVSLGDMQSLSIWQFLLKEINEYDETTVTRITNIVQNTPKNKVQEELQKWIDADPRHELAEKCLNPILNKFFLELDVNAGNVPITLRTIGGVKIDSSYLSTGTRQILSTAIPLYKFDTNDTVILFDEPERSLFPDIQRELVKHYTSLAPEAQFFFATHSPIIASAFEPCERFILYFDENGEVEFHNGVAPEGDDPNDILSEDFGMEELMLQTGLDAYERYRNLFVEIKNEKDPIRQKELIVEQAKLGDEYKF